MSGQHWEDCDGSCEEFVCERCEAQLGACMEQGLDGLCDECWWEAREDGTLPDERRYEQWCFDTMLEVKARDRMTDFRHPVWRFHEPTGKEVFPYAPSSFPLFRDHELERIRSRGGKS